MGICLSCLGVGGRESHDSESSRLLDDDIYQSNYGYGSVGPSQQQGAGPDPEDLKREREALEAICQRTSDSVVDIWSHHHYIHNTASSSRTPSHQTTPAIEEPPSHPSYDQQQPSNEASQRDRDASPTPGDDATKSAPLRTSKQGANLSAVPKHWGEVVMTTRAGRKTRPGLVQTLDQENDKEVDVFGVLVVK